MSMIPIQQPGASALRGHPIQVAGEGLGFEVGGIMIQGDSHEE